ncbi:MAG: hypothetical protein DRP65_01030 [Planctomycetota bacterium]|nr:MAG: hypothetical protein DRP65_01030 [Planctomycetota bacterium]
MKQKQQKNRRILVIDDNESIHKDFREILEVGGTKTATLDEAKAAILGDAAKASEREGFEIDSAFQGAEGLAKVKEALAQGKPYAMAFVDVRMPPGWDGVETIKHLWAEYPELEVVICTAYSDYQWSDIIDKLGQSDQLLILKKPFDNVEVQQLACALTEKWSLGRQTELKQKDLEDAVIKRTRELSKTNEQLKQEIEERKIAEKKLVQAAAEWRTTFDSISDFVTIHDMNFRIIMANRAIADFLKVEPNDLIGKKCYEMLHGLSEPCATCPHQRTLETRQPCTANFFEPHLGMHIEVFTSPIFDNKGELTGSVHIARDITDRKLAEEKLREQDRMKTEFVVNMSHELRTPLAIFKNIISNLKAGVAGKMNDQQLKNLEVADKEIDRLARIISDFLDISRIEAGKINLRMQPVRIQSLVSDVVELLGPLADAKNIELTVSMADGDLSVNADRDRMVQVLANLINNGIKFVPDCGGKIAVQVRELDDEISISVEDNGPGIAMEDKSKVFGRFVQGDKHVGPGYQGPGLGLAISKELVELHGGRIEVTSEVGCGTTFTVFIPLIPECARIN